MYISSCDIKKLIKNPIDFAIQMEPYQIDYVLEKFLDARNIKQKYGGNFMKSKWQKEYNPPHQ